MRSSESSIAHPAKRGAWSPETLMRIFGVVQERGVRSRLRGDQELHGAILEIDPLCAIETGGVSKQVEETAEKLQARKCTTRRQTLTCSTCPWSSETSSAAMVATSTWSSRSLATLWFERTDAERETIAMNVRSLPCCQWDQEPSRRKEGHVSKTTSLNFAILQKA